MNKKKALGLGVLILVLLGIYKYSPVILAFAATSLGIIMFGVLLLILVGLFFFLRWCFR